ncbi:right-handed parallel beta-helix repeat-containing protein [Marivirga sp. S37H4]|uniref:Right-handed parallel beta-helix repeat-containing protein n=1 Tax=Marivirga aurantiaca TaxID=2802615 RepID=A0A934WZN6_9BACT|nr:parallel beta-helix domain-containing protein [Marivirga aurantiaca]MBK6265792.1 right-handed parallel beta-helix repeat-containing protein [Marivirga aurantiaca]
MKKLFFILLILNFAGCTSNEEVADRSQVNWQSIEKDLQSALILAEEGDTINIPGGYFKFEKSLLMDDKQNVVIAGAGMDETILSFKNQNEGAEGLKISQCKNITLVDFTVEDAAGDNIKVSDTDGITFRRLRAQWTGEVSETNGAYALYPVLCKNVLIEECIAIGSSDAGIYVGQSDSVIIRNNEAYRNVAGIESENSNFVEVYGNKAINNTGGILIFDLPGLTQYGEHIKVYDNLIQENNHRNFAPAGNIVGVVPPGTGLMILATRNVEVFNNQIIDNRTVGAAIVSYELVAAISEEEAVEADETQAGSAERINSDYELDENYNPHVGNIYFHDNNFQNSKWFATFQHDFGKLFNFKSPFNPPDIVFDGFMEAERSPAEILCIQEKQKLVFINLDAPNDLEDLNENIAPFVCD